jgi:hypothetical protein
MAVTEAIESSFNFSFRRNGWDLGSRHSSARNRHSIENYAKRKMKRLMLPSYMEGT